MKTIINNTLVSRMEHAIMDAYSYDRYGSRNWRASIRFLLSCFKESQVECILRSKVMRLAGDHYEGPRGGIHKNTVKKYLANPENIDYTLQILEECNLS